MLGLKRQEGCLCRAGRATEQPSRLGKRDKSDKDTNAYEPKEPSSQPQGNPWALCTPDLYQPQPAPDPSVMVLTAVMNLCCVLSPGEDSQETAVGRTDQNQPNKNSCLHGTSIVLGEDSA